MKKWTGALRDSFFAALGREQVPTHSPLAVWTIRQAMLAMLDGEGPPQRVAPVRDRLLRTIDIEGLWYARAELYNQLCHTSDEVHAARCLKALEPLFQGHLPKTLLHTRPPGATGLSRNGDCGPTSLDDPN